MAIGKITKRSVDSFPVGERDQFLWDVELKGFGLKLTPKGARSYVYQYRLGGREAKVRRYTIGRHGSPWTPTTAREEAIRIAQTVSRGIDPVACDKERRRQAVDLAFTKYSVRFQESCTGAGWRRMVERTLRLQAVPVLGDKPMPMIRRSDITLVLDRIPASQIALRRNTFAVLRRLFRWASARGDIDRSPCEGMDTPIAVIPRDRVLTDCELAAIWEATDEVSKLFGSIIKMLIVTGQRREEVAGLDWCELDQASASWTLPKERAKNGNSNLIPLNELAIKVLDEAARGVKWPTRGLVFATSGGKAFTGFAKGKAQLDKRVKLGDAASPWRIHDLRRTLATGLQRLGTRFEVVEAVLNHVGGSKSGVAGIYQRHDWANEKRVALEAWGRHVKQVLAPSTATNVVPLASAHAKQSA